MNLSKFNSSVVQGIELILIESSGIFEYPLVLTSHGTCDQGLMGIKLVQTYYSYLTLIHIGSESIDGSLRIFNTHSY